MRKHRKGTGIHISYGLGICVWQQREAIRRTNTILQKEPGIRRHSIRSKSFLRAGKPLWEGYPTKNAQLARVRVLFNIKGNLSHIFKKCIKRACNPQCLRFMLSKCGHLFLHVLDIFLMDYKYLKCVNTMGG
jgi:hypothetical protein